MAAHNLLQKSAVPCSAQTKPHVIYIPQIPPNLSTNSAMENRCVQGQALVSRASPFCDCAANQVGGARTSQYCPWMWKSKNGSQNGNHLHNLTTNWLLAGGWPRCALLTHALGAVERPLGENGVTAVTLVWLETKGDCVLVNEIWAARDEGVLSHTPSIIGWNKHINVTFVCQQRTCLGSCVPSRNCVPSWCRKMLGGGLIRSDSGVQPFLWAGPCVSVCSPFLPQRI